MAECPSSAALQSRDCVRRGSKVTSGCTVPQGQRSIDPNNGRARGGNECYNLRFEAPAQAVNLNNSINSRGAFARVPAQLFRRRFTDSRVSGCRWSQRDPSEQGHQLIRIRRPSLAPSDFTLTKS
ncbi:hypothetical protein MPTK2_2g19460 [Marchantia polymorpha subsp. ruderalis]